MIEFKNVSKTYETGNRAVRNISLRIKDGEFVFIVGRSGSGKSTLLKLITRELKATEGSIQVNGRYLEKLKYSEIPRYRRGLGIVFQDFRLLSDRNVYENIAFAQRVIGAPAREIREKVPEILKLTGLSAKYKNMPNQLSGGEQQRVAIARALINRPSVILADEPTGNLDEKNSDEIMKLLYEINSMGTTVIVITHSRAIVESSGKRVIAMNKGVIVSDTASADFAAGIRAAEEAVDLRLRRAELSPDAENAEEAHTAAAGNDDRDRYEAPWEEAAQERNSEDVSSETSDKPGDSKRKAAADTETHKKTADITEASENAEDIDDTLPWDTDEDGKDVMA